MKNVKLDSRMMILGGLGVVALIVAVAGFLLAVQPQLSKASSLNDQVRDAQLEFAGMHSGTSTVPTVHAAELFQLARAMPDDPDVADVLLDMSRAATASGASLVAVQPTTPVAQSDGATALPFNVTVDGSWQTVTAFLHALRTQVIVHGNSLAVSGRLINVDKIAISAGQTNGGGEIQALMTVSAFTYGTAKPPATTTTGTTTTTSSSTSAQAAGSGGGN